jgi:CRISPR-associated protein Csd1
MLQEIVQYGRQVGITGEAGFLPKTIRWLLTFSSAGKYLGLVPLAEGPKSKGREFPKAPHLRFAGDTPMRQFLVDTAEYALMYGSVKQADKLKVKHEFVLRLLRDASAAEPILAKIADAIADDSVRAGICSDLEQQKAKPSDSVTFAEMRDGEPRIIVEQDTWHNWWRSSFRALFDKKGNDGKKAKAAIKASQVRCFITGDLVEPCPTHPKIKGLGGDVGGLIDTTLIGFNKDAFCSYGLEQSANAAVGSQAAEDYAAALNKLIANQSHRLAGAKVVYWYVGDKLPGKEEDPVAELFTGMDFGDAEVENDPEAQPVNPKVAQVQATSRAGELLDAIRSGERAELRNCQYRALTLSGNAGRVVVRDWMQGQFEELAENVNKWFGDLEIVHRYGLGNASRPKFRAVLAGMVRDLSDIPAPLVATLWRSAIQDLPIPPQAAAQALARVTIDVINDNPASHARMGLLKAYVIRKEICPMQPELNEHLTDPAYLSGRIMAILAAIQRKALGDVGAGVVQRYYAAASATPALVLGRLVRLAQVGHLPKIEPAALRNWYDNQLAEPWNLLKKNPPKCLSMEEQTLFAMGYYQQKAKRPAGAGQNDEPSEA